MADHFVLTLSRTSETTDTVVRSLGANPTKAYDRVMTQFSIDMPLALQCWVESRIAEGRFTDAADYLRDLVRRDQEAAADDTEWVRAMIAEGLASGISSQKPDTIIENMSTRRKARRG